jgi:hypothetical protein
VLSTEALAVGFMIAFWIAAICTAVFWHSRRDARRRDHAREDDRDA